MTKVKFCGVTRPADAALASELGASYVGVILAESRRRVTIERAAQIFSAAGVAKRVGVFGHVMSSGEIVRHARDSQLDVIQLHGSFTPEEIIRMRDDFEGEIWAVVPVDEMLSALPEGWDILADVSDALLLDTRVRGVTGGTGKAFDWRAAAPSIRPASVQLPIVLAGGLNPENVGEAITALHPTVVDVSSGVESAPGIKSPDLMRAFADAVVSASIV